MILTTCTLYYLTNTLGTSMLPYRDNMHYAQFLIQSKYYINVPMAVSVFPEEICISPKAWVAKTGRLKWYRGRHPRLSASREAADGPD